MAKPIVHFMWGYQPHFRISQQCDAERVFQKLDNRFTPEVFLVGIRQDQDGRGYPACVEPEDDFWITSESFDNVLELSKELLDKYPEAKMIVSHPLAQERFSLSLTKRSIKDAIADVIDSHHNKSKAMTYYVSEPAQVDGYWVSVVLGLQIEVVMGYYSLKNGVVPIHECRTISVPRSLIDSTAKEFLSRSTQELLKPDPGCGISSSNTDDIIRAAGARLMTGIVWRTSQHCISAMHTLFEDITTISSLRYEQGDSVGTILLACKDYPMVNDVIGFQTFANLNEHRAARKLLEMTSESLRLHSDCEGIFGLCRMVSDNYDESAEDIFEVCILGHHHWELRHAGNALMQVQYGQPSLPKQPFDEGKLRLDLPRIFKQISNENVDKLIDLVRTAEKQANGTMLIITEEAEKESNRLRMQGTPIKPCVLTSEILQNITSIDGAVIMSPQGVGIGIGVILDGLAGPELGDPGRGARYNSALRYIESAKIACMAVVVSEDGGITFIPDLRRTINRHSIDRRLTALKALLAKNKVERKVYYGLIDWFNNHRYYLRQQDCDILNGIIPQLDQCLKEQEPEGIFIVTSKFFPNNDLDESLYYCDSEPTQ